MKPQKGQIILGYLCTRLLSNNNTSRCEYTHILIAKTFLPNPNNYPIVNHIDGNKHNNRIENLEWCTYSRNNKHAIDIGLRKKYVGFLKDFEKKKK